MVEVVSWVGNKKKRAGYKTLPAFKFKKELLKRRFILLHDQCEFYVRVCWRYSNIINPMHFFGCKQEQEIGQYKWPTLLLF